LSRAQIAKYSPISKAPEEGNEAVGFIPAGTYLYRPDESDEYYFDPIEVNRNSKTIKDYCEHTILTYRVRKAFNVNDGLTDNHLEPYGTMYFDDSFCKEDYYNTELIPNHENNLIKNV
jgi:hypothetical protein